MPEIHLVNGQPRECSDAITARGLLHEWLANPDATEAKVAAILAVEAAARTAHPPEPKHQQNQFVKPPDTVSAPSRRSRAPEPPKAEE